MYLCISDSKYHVFYNGRRVVSRRVNVINGIPEGGELILGQSSRDILNLFVNPELAFLGICSLS